MSEFLGIKVLLRPWCDQDPGILESWNPKILGMLEFSGVEAPLLWAPCDCLPRLRPSLCGGDRKEPEPMVGRCSCVHGTCWSQLLPVCWSRCCVLLTGVPKILGELECLGVALPLGIVELAGEFVPKVCSGHSPEWKKPMPLVGQGSCVSGSHWSQLLPVLGQILCSHL